MRVESPGARVDVYGKRARDERKVVIEYLQLVPSGGGREFWMRLAEEGPVEAERVDRGSLLLR